MTAHSKTWILGGLATINAMVAFSLGWSWQFVYQEHSYPIDFFFPLNATRDRIVVCLLVAAITVPLGLLTYRMTGKELHVIPRILSLVSTCTAALLAIAYLVWSAR